MSREKFWFCPFTSTTSETSVLHCPKDTDYRLLGRQKNHLCKKRIILEDISMWNGAISLLFLTVYTSVLLSSVPGRIKQFEREYAMLRIGLRYSDCVRDRVRRFYTDSKSDLDPLFVSKGSVCLGSVLVHRKFFQKFSVKLYFRDAFYNLIITVLEEKNVCDSGPRISAKYTKSVRDPDLEERNIVLLPSYSLFLG